jgi:hypothetical protein
MLPRHAVERDLEYNGWRGLRQAASEKPPRPEGHTLRKMIPENARLVRNGAEFRPSATSDRRRCWCGPGGSGGRLC